MTQSDNAASHEPDAPRDYLHEAYRIILGDTLLLPEKAHLIAMKAQIDGLTRTLEYRSFAS